MSTIIIYLSRHGCTEKTADILKQNLNDNVMILNLKDNIQLDLSIYDTVIIGGSIHAGKIQKKLAQFCKDHNNQLMRKKLGLYLCCMEEGAKAQQQMQNAFPENLREHASATGFFGGEFDFSKMNFLEKFIIKKVAKVKESVSTINKDAIKEFAGKIQK